ncbi:hypothetical protein OG357_13345 [Streptomyces sp. NBC_01255]|uniref:hypothetical protein n=1 Tax=Streptomyces sp. NBC_01255 TaxID=2903798 RepID=UPI002E329715|nr:hypothetical protein [Streptomyces sp. NBC_01255]
MRNKLTAGLATTCLSAATLALLPAASAEAADPMCRAGSIKYTWSTVSKSPVVTHRKAIEHYTGGVVTKTVSASSVTSITASVTATSGVEVSGSVAMASFSGKVGLELKAEGSKTKTTAESITHRLSSRGKYVLYSGTVKTQGYYTQFRCDRGTRWVNTGNYGKAISFTVATEGGLKCGTSVPAGSLASYAKRYC